METEFNLVFIILDLDRLEYFFSVFLAFDDIFKGCLKSRETNSRQHQEHTFFKILKNLTYNLP